MSEDKPELEDFAGRIPEYEIKRPSGACGMMKKRGHYCHNDCYDGEEFCEKCREEKK